MKQAPPHICQGANPKHDGTGIYRDTKLIYKSMEGLSTQDTKLIWRVVHAHWDTHCFEAIKAAYFKRRKAMMEYHTQ
ncbi:hypothetical protein DXG01_006199 [Tephrocybe rancida]|nr:hypothetical protein DXG01_006199 [Tephrocybe rancida]